MIFWKRAVLLGLLSWLIPLSISYAVHPLKRVNAPLFNSIMDLVVLITAGILLARYFRDRPMPVREALLVGTLWLVMNLAFDYPLFIYGLRTMTAFDYYSEIGLVNLTYPIFASLSAWLANP